MVLLPYSEGMHISKKITDEAVRAKLQELAAPYVQEGCGFIIRTEPLRLVLTKSVVIWNIYGVHGNMY